jgi:hypothetical protein
MAVYVWVAELEASAACEWYGRSAESCARWSESLGLTDQGEYSIGLIFDVVDSRLLERDESESE